MIVICTTYFNSQKDPQRNITIEGSNFNYISGWYNSVLKNNLKGVIFHDGLNPDFISKYNNENISFIKVIPKNYSLNDFRFFCYYEFIKISSFKYYFFTDGNDVIVNNDLNKLINKYPNKIFFGRDNIRKWRSHIWNYNKLLDMEHVLDFEVPNSFLEMPVYNAGIIGGERSQMILFLNTYVLLYKKESDKNINMAIVNWIIYIKFLTAFEKFRFKFVNLIPKRIYRKIILSILKGRLSKYNTESYSLVNFDSDNPSKKHIISGYPLNSNYKKYLKPFETNSFFIHK
jgi:hypothetical protein